MQSGRFGWSSRTRTGSPSASASGWPTVSDLSSDEDALVVLTEAELLLGADHPFAHDAAHLLRLEREPAIPVTFMQPRADLRVRDDIALGEVRGTGDDGLLAARAVVHRREQQLVCVRVLLELGDPPDPDVLPSAARPFDPIHLGAAHVQLARDVIGRAVRIGVLLQPGDRNPDGGHQTLSR